MSFITPGSAPLPLKCSNKKTEYGLDAGMGPHGLYLRKVASHQHHPKGKTLSTATSMASPRSKALSWESEAHLRTGHYGSLRVLPALPTPETWGAAAAAAKSRQSCPTLLDPMDCSLPDSSVHGISQARVLEWGAIAFSRDFRRPWYKNLHL